MPNTHLTPADERRLVAQLVKHDRLEGYAVCQTCRLTHPCPTRQDATQQLRDAGLSVDGGQTIWS